MNDEVGIDEQDQRSAWRSQWQQIRERFDSQIGNEDELLDLIFAPFDLLGLGLEITDGDPLRIVRSHSQWKNLKVGHALPEEAKRNFRWIADIQSKLLNDVIPDWQVVLEQRELLDIILQQWFSPSSRNKNDRRAVGAIQICSLDTIIVALTDQVHDANGQLRHRRKSWSILQKILPSLIDQISLLDIEIACQELLPLNKRQLQWTSFIRQLLSLPDRIANAYEGKFPDTLSLHHIRSKIGQEVVTLRHAEVDPLFISDSLSRMLRAGWFQDLQGWEEKSYSVWPAILRQVAETNEDGQEESKRTGKWSQIVAMMPEDDQKALLNSLIYSLDRLVKKDGIAQLINGSELGRPGAEGKEFMLASTWDTALTLAAIIEIFLPVDQDEDQGKIDDSFLSGLFPDSTNFLAWSPLTARILVHILSKFDVDFKHRGNLLLRLVKVWSQQSKIASLDEEIYLSTLILLLIHVMPVDSEVVKQLSTLSEFIEGVSQHLKHLSPTVQRLGMLLAETVSEQAGKGINFGKSVWEGRGKGREEARVLRSLALGFASRKMEINFSKEEILSALHLNTTTDHPQTLQHPVIIPKKSREPISRTLPARKSAPMRKPMIQLLDGDSEGEGDEQYNPNAADVPSLTNIRGTRNMINPISDDEQSSSSDPDTSSEEDVAPNELDGATEEGKAFGLTTPSNKKKGRPPIYIGELAPLLRSNERDNVRIGLKFAEDLIRRKTGWGGEVEENAIDLALALLSIHNNFKISQFEQRRVDAITALVIACPTRIGPCLAEQYFDHQYAMAQRIAMLNAMAFGAAELATGKKIAARIGNGLQKDQSKTAITANKLAEQFSQLAMQRAREEGKERMPEIRNEEALLVSKPNTKTKTQGLRVMEMQRMEGLYTSFANSCFIFPLVNRLWNHIQSSNALMSKTTSRYLGAGRGIIDSPFMMGSLIDSIAVLCNYGQNEPSFRQDVVPEVVQLILTLTRSHLSLLAQNVPIDEEADSDGGSRSTVLGASASLVLVLLDACWQLDFGMSLARQNANLLMEVQYWASAIFEASDGGSSQFGSVDRSVGLMDRSGRASAAILLRINEIRQHGKGKK